MSVWLLVIQENFVALPFRIDVNYRNRVVATAVARVKTFQHIVVVPLAIAPFRSLPSVDIISNSYTVTENSSPGNLDS